MNDEPIVDDRREMKGDLVEGLELNMTMAEEKTLQDENNGVEDPAEEEVEDADEDNNIQDEDEPTDDPTPIELGGNDCTNGKPAYALLTGVWIDRDDESDSVGEEITVNIPITSLPVIVGRSWDSAAKDPHHVSLPRDEKLLSRLHACIFYRDAKGGKLGCYQIVSGDDGSTSATNKIIYKPLESNKDADDSFDPDSIYRLPGMKQTDPLPKNGFFAIECLGRHTIKVGQKKVTKGKQAMLQDGIPIQIASYCFYFLLPKDAPSISQTFKYPVKKAPQKKIKSKEAERNEDDEPPPKKSRKSEDGYTSRLDNISTEELFSMLTSATQSEDWSKEDQLIGAALGKRIVREAANDSKIQWIASQQHGITQREIIEWYNAQQRFANFESLMLLKIELKSYHTGITKAIQRAGYTRNETNPGKSRCTRWDLPSDVELVPQPPASPRSYGRSPSKSSDGTTKIPAEAKKPEATVKIPADLVNKPIIGIQPKINNDKGEVGNKEKNEKKEVESKVSDASMSKSSINNTDNNLLSELKESLSLPNPDQS